MTLTLSQRQAVNVAIAEVCGVPLSEWEVKMLACGECWVCTKCGETLLRHVERQHPICKRPNAVILDYSGSLDAMAQAEATLTEEQMQRYVEELGELNKDKVNEFHKTKAGSAWHITICSPPQTRAFAFIRTNRPEFQLPE